MGGNEKLTIPVSKLILRINSKGLKIVFLDPKHLLRNPSGRRELHPLIEEKYLRVKLRFGIHAKYSLLIIAIYLHR